MAAYIVYRNLTNGLLSVRDRKTKLVVAHCEQIVLGNAHTVVNESGRLYVIKKKKKFVHAYIVGDIVDMIGARYYKGRTVEIPRIGMYQKELLCQEGTSITYNPFKHETFIERETGRSIAGEKFNFIHICKTGSVTAY